MAEQLPTPPGDRPVNPYRCLDRCIETNQQCDLQPRHGGNMHGAVYASNPESGRYWWRDSDGRIETFRG